MSDLTTSVSKLVELSKQIKEARKDIKILATEEKKLKCIVKEMMVNQNLDVINLNKGKILVNKGIKKTGINKNSIKHGLLHVFEGDEDRTETALKIIVDNLPTKETTTISIRGI